MEYLGAWGTLIHEKNLEVENIVSDSLLKLQQFFFLLEIPYTGTENDRCAANFSPKNFAD
jgi:hypothetical protein